MSNKYKRGLLGFGGGMHSTEWHSSWCQDPLTSLLKLKWYKYRVDLIEISDCKLNLFPHSEWQRCNNQLINRSIDKPVYRFIFQAKMTNFRYFSVRICWLLDPLTFPPAPPTCQISWLHACLTSAAWKSRILCTLFNFSCLILHFLHPVCLKRAVEILSGSHGDRQTLQTIKNLYSSGCLLGYKKIKGEGGGLNFRSLHVHIPAFIYVLFSDHRPHWSLTKEWISPSTYGWETAE